MVPWCHGGGVAASISRFARLVRGAPSLPVGGAAAPRSSLRSSGSSLRSSNCEAPGGRLRRLYFALRAASARRTMLYCPPSVGRVGGIDLSRLKKKHEWFQRPDQPDSWNPSDPPVQSDRRKEPCCQMFLLADHSAVDDPWESFSSCYVIVKLF